VHAIATTSLLPRLHQRLRAPALALLLGTMLAGTIARNRVWRDERSLWADVIEKSPHKARGYFQLGQTYASENTTHAQQLYERGLEIEPRNPIGHTNLGLILLSAGNTEIAMTHLRTALALGGDRPLVWNNIGVVQLRSGEIEEESNHFAEPWKATRAASTPDGI
jgi:Tfp pilus assembly protein PilF